MERTYVHSVTFHTPHCCCIESSLYVQCKWEIDYVIVCITTLLGFPTSEIVAHITLISYSICSLSLSLSLSPPPSLSRPTSPSTIGTPQYQLSCPHLEGDSVGICVEACPSDGNCPSGQLCCSNGCGHSCVEAVRIPYHTPPTDSMCPPIDDDVAGTCVDRCTSDSDCAYSEMCCSNGCGHVCMPPMSACKAIQFTVSNQSLIGGYLPQCEEDGNFSRVQCHGSTGYCWCVETEGGVPVSGAVRFKRPQCSELSFFVWYTYTCTCK